VGLLLQSFQLLFAHFFFFTSTENLIIPCAQIAIYGSASIVGAGGPRCFNHGCL
jgi:hypothetical protein